MQSLRWASGASNSGPNGYFGLGKYLPQVGQEWCIQPWPFSHRPAPRPPLKPSVDERKINSSFHPLGSLVYPHGLPPTPCGIFSTSPDNFLQLSATLFLLQPKFFLPSSAGFFRFLASLLLECLCRVLFIVYSRASISAIFFFWVNTINDKIGNISKQFITFLQGSLRK